MAIGEVGAASAVVPSRKVGEHGVLVLLKVNGFEDGGVQIVERAVVAHVDGADAGVGGIPVGASNAKDLETPNLWGGIDRLG